MQRQFQGAATEREFTNVQTTGTSNGLEKETKVRFRFVLSTDFIRPPPIKKLEDLQVQGSKQQLIHGHCNLLQSVEGCNSPGPVTDLGCLETAVAQLNGEVVRSCGIQCASCGALGLATAATVMC